MKKHLEGTCARSALMGAAAAAALAGLAGPAPAQEPETETLVVTGLRASLESSTAAKRDAVAVTDSVFAEDIGKFPDLTIAESLSRVPGVQISRNINGEGVLISVRGLGTDFTKIMMNGAQVAVASSGSVDAQNQNREVDLSIFPTELFARLDVQKTPLASNLEGGVAGIVDMRAARPFDYKESQLTYQLQSEYGEASEDYSWRGGLLGSWRRQTDFGEVGVLGGVALVRNKFYTEGFETIGWTNPTLSAGQCGTGNTCGAGGGNGFTIPATVTGDVGLGIAPGPIDQARLLALNPGTTIAQIDEALVPRLGRLSYSDGDRDRDAAIVGVQWAPSEGAELYLDVMGIQTDRRWDRSDLDWAVRFNSPIPKNLTLYDDLVVRSGDFANTFFFLEARPYSEQIEFASINPGGSFDLTDRLQWNVAANWSRSNFFRRDPTILVNSPFTTASFDNPGDPFPVITTPVDLNDPNAGWSWTMGPADAPVRGRVNLTQEKRVTFTEGLHTDVRLGDGENNLRLGFAYDSIGRTISARSNDAAWGLAVCGNPCAGGPGSAVPQSALASYLRPGPAGFITVDYASFLEDTNYYALSATAPEVNTATTAASSGGITEDTTGAWIEKNGRFDVAGRPLAYNVGVRQIHTEQAVFGPQTATGKLSSTSTYDVTLPSGNLAYDVLPDVKLRLSASKTITRANPSVLAAGLGGISNPGGLPHISFSDPSAQNATQGNPGLEPYESDNYDVGVEWYTGGEGYVALTGFKRQITGFTTTQITTHNFPDLGIPLTDLTADQQAGLRRAYVASGSTQTFEQWLATWAVGVSTQVNSDDPLDIEGYEATWVQPLDFLVEGLGFTANYTNVAQEAEGSAPAKAIGISPFTYNWTGYYENFGLTLRASYTFQAGQVISGPNQNGIPAAELFADERGQWDFSASYLLEALPSAPQITLNVTNLTSEPLRTYFRYPEATYTYYEPGYSVLLGIRGTF